MMESLNVIFFWGSLFANNLKAANWQHKNISLHLRAGKVREEFGSRLMEDLNKDKKSNGFSLSLSELSRSVPSITPVTPL